MSSNKIIKHIKTKRTIISMLIIVTVFSFGRAYYNSKIDNAFSELSEKNITKIHIRQSSVSGASEYEITDDKRIKMIKEYLINLNKNYIATRKSLSYNGKYSYYLSFEDDKSPPHYTFVDFSGKQYIDLRIYNYNEGKFENYRAKIKLDEDELKRILLE